MTAPMYTADTLRSFTTALGGERDKAAQLYWAHIRLTAEQIRTAYEGGGTFTRKAIDIPAFDMVREGWEWQGDAEQIKAIEEESRRLGLLQRIRRWIVLARLWGGAALILGDGAADPMQPLRKIGKGGLKYVHVASKMDLIAGDIDLDLMSPGFGEPERYSVAGKSGMVDLHPSRVARLIGAERADDWVYNDGWGDSVLEAVNQSLMAAGAAPQVILGLLQEAKIDIWKIKDFAASMATQEMRDGMLTRIGLANAAKSTQNAILMDLEEEYEQKTVNFSNLDKVAYVFLEIAAGSVDIPLTRFLGQSPAGLNSTGEADLRNYYDHIGAQQNLFLRPQLEKLFAAVKQSAGVPEDLTFRFNPLWKLSEKDEAEVQYKKAQTAQVYDQTGLIPKEPLAEAVINRLSEDEFYPGLSEGVDEYLAGVERGLTGEGEDDPEQPEDPQRGNGGQGGPAADAAHVIRVGDGKALVRPGAVVRDAEPRSLYVSRKVLNAEAIRAHFKAQGFTTMVLATEMHVTILFSREPVDWFAIGAEWSRDPSGNMTIPAGGPRAVQMFGGAAVVLEFASSDLKWRHREMIEKGAKSDYPEYRPHVTLTYGKAPDLKAVEPWQGPIELGPEVFAEIVEDWASGVTEDGRR